MKRLVPVLVIAVVLVPAGSSTASSSSTIDVSGGALQSAKRLDNAVSIAKPEPPVTGTSLDPELQLVLDLTNLERTSRGLAPLTHNPLLGSAAQLHSQDQADMRTLTHTGSDGSNPGERITRAGYSWRTWAENAAAGYRTAHDLVAAWMNSPGHRANLLNPSVTEIGLGVAATPSGYRYWTQKFAAPR